MYNYKGYKPEADCMDKIIERIINESECPQLLDILQNMKMTDLQSLLIKIYRDKALKLTPVSVLKQYEENRFVDIAGISPLQLIEFEKLAFDNLPAEFDPIILSPVSPLGSCSALGTVDQNKIVTTIRNTEVCADSTNIMALESAKRRKSLNTDELVKLASYHRLLRAQKFDNPAFSTHFGVFCLSTAGKLSAGHDNLIISLSEHIEFYLKFIQNISTLGLVAEDVKVGITAINQNLKQKLQEQIVVPLAEKYPEFTFLLDQTRTTALNYYKDVSLAINLKSPVDGNYYQLGDGGNTDWTQKLLNNNKEFFLSSCIGVDLFLKMFKKPQDSKIKIAINNELELSNIYTEDAQNLVLQANNPLVAANLRDIFPNPYTLADAYKFINSTKDNNYILAIRFQGKLIGVIGITPQNDIYRNEVEIGFWLGQEYWNKGIMQLCLKSYTSYIFEKFHFNRIYSKVFADNIASAKVHEKCGFVKEGTLRQNVIKNGKIQDTYIYALLFN